MSAVQIQSIEDRKAKLIAAHEDLERSVRKFEWDVRTLASTPEREELWQHEARALATWTAALFCEEVEIVKDMVRQELMMKYCGVN